MPLKIWIRERAEGERVSISELRGKIQELPRARTKRDSADCSWGLFRLDRLRFIFLSLSLEALLH